MKLEGHMLEYRGENLYFQLRRYAGKRMRIDLVTSDNVPYATLTTNIPEQELEDREVIIKSWAENDDICQVVKRTGLFKDTGKRVPGSFVQAEIWAIREDLELPGEQ